MLTRTWRNESLTHTAGGNVRGYGHSENSSVFPRKGNKQLPNSPATVCLAICPRGETTSVHTKPVYRSVHGSPIWGSHSAVLRGPGLQLPQEASSQSASMGTPFCFPFESSWALRSSESAVGTLRIGQMCIHSLLRLAWLQILNHWHYPLHATEHTWGHLFSSFQMRNRTQIPSTPRSSNPSWKGSTAQAKLSMDAMVKKLPQNENNFMKETFYVKSPAVWPCF